jgi:hypothetical protein
MIFDRKSTLKAFASYVSVAAALAAAAQPALAFCGFYAARADGKLTNKASEVVLARSGDVTAITMSSDYEGDPKDFALVIPVPTVVKKEDIHVVDQIVVNRLDRYSEPRLVEYSDPDPCPPPIEVMRRTVEKSVYANRLSVPAPVAAPAPVTVEARYSVEEYEIVILSAKQSDGLQSWLTENGYKIPPGASSVLGSYIKQKMHFFVAKVDLNRMAVDGRHFIRPLQVRYQSAKFMLPIRLGTVNANGPQDLILMTLTTRGRVEPTNYETVKVPTGMDVPLYIRDKFTDFYRTTFDRQVEQTDGASVFLEYAWNAGSCDPCSAPPPAAADLATLGAKWLEPPQAPPGPGGDRAPALRSPMPPFGFPGGTFVTRLHVRYDQDHFPEDLLLNETDDRQTFQGRYVLHNLWTGDASCPAGQQYWHMVEERSQRELRNVANLTGWSREDIAADMAQSGETTVP